MARSSSTSDIFAAIAEPRRREIVEVLARRGQQPVNDLVATLRLPQPAVSKHLAVLRQVGLVSVTRRGRERIYSVNARELKAVHDWAKGFERYWDHHLDRLKERAEALAKQRVATNPKPENKP